jgi:signal transduction histidine kinase
MLFKVFSSVHKNNSGAGLGLTIFKALAQKLGDGIIDLIS